MVAVGPKNFVKLLWANPSRIFMLISLFCTILVLPMRLACQIIVEDYLVTLAIVFLPTYILYLGRGIKTITVFAHIIHRVIKTDMISFLAIYLIFLMGFSQGTINDILNNLNILFLIIFLLFKTTSFLHYIRLW